MALTYGSRGAAISALQSQLNAYGVKVAVDGIYGPATEAALAVAYAKAGLSGQSGVASDELLGALNAAVGPGKSVIGATPPNSTSSTEVSSTWGLDLTGVTGMSTGKKIALGLAGVVALGLVFKK